MPRNRTRRRSDSNAASSNPTPAPPRSKSGCWTCRIRRKRCDETQDETGACLACKRLDIECLGWGTKRPEWCRDKEALNQYKLSLKRKLCSRAGTRPSAASTGGLVGLEAARILLPTIEPHHDVTRAPSGESPSSPESTNDDLMPSNMTADTGDFLDFAFSFSPSPHSAMSQLPPSASADSSDSSHLFFSPNMHHQQRHPNHHHHIHHHHRPKPQPQPLSRIASQLLSLLKRTSLPAEYASIASQLLDLHLFKSHALASQSSHANVEHEAARRAQLIDAELTRLANRSAFDNLFAGTTGFAFDPSTFLSPSQSHPSTSPYTYSSPMTVWSPELVSDSMSTFSGSSAPTSPAAPLLAMSSSHHASTSLDLFYDPMAQHQQHQHQQLYDSYLPMHHTLAQPQHQPQQQQFGSALGFGNLGALGLSSDFLFSDYSSSPSISLLPPTPTPTMLPPPAKVAPSAAIASVVPPSPTQPQHDSDPLQIHHETCTLLLQAVLSTTGSSQFEYVNPSQELEECLQRLTTKFAPLSLSSSPSLSTEYLFGATVAGAMSVSADRRAFFRRIVAAIESRSASSECIAMLDEAWRD